MWVGWRTQREGLRAISFIRGRQQGSFLSNCSEKSREMSDWQPASGKKSKSITFSLEGVMMAVGKSLQVSRAVRTTCRGGLSGRSTEVVQEKVILPEVVLIMQLTLQREGREGQYCCLLQTYNAMILQGEGWEADCYKHTMPECDVAYTSTYSAHKNWLQCNMLIAWSVIQEARLSRS